MARKTEEPMIERGDSDVFHDLVLPDADELLTKSKLARAIAVEIKRRKLTQTQFAAITGIDQSNTSWLMHGRISGFSSDRLMHILTQLDQDVVIFIRPKPAAEMRAAYVDVAHGV